MVDSFELDKQRDIVFDAEPPVQIERAHKFLSGLSDCKVEFNETTNTMRVSYNLRHYTIEGLENALSKEGFPLENSKETTPVELAPII